MSVVRSSRMPQCCAMLIASLVSPRQPGLFHASEYPRLRRALSRISLAEACALQHRRRCLRQVGRARSEPARDPERARRRRRPKTSPSAGCARPRTGSPTRSRRTASRAATASRCCCRRRRKPPPAHIAIYKLGAVAVPLAILFGVDALSYRLQNAGVKAVITNAQGLAKLSRDPPRAAGPRAGALDRRAGRGRARLPRDDRARVRPISRRPPRRRTIPR